MKTKQNIEYRDTSTGSVAKITPLKSVDLVNVDFSRLALVGMSCALIIDKDDQRFDYIGSKDASACLIIVLKVASGINMVLHLNKALEMSDESINLMKDVIDGDYQVALLSGNSKLDSPIVEKHVKFFEWDNRCKLIEVDCGNSKGNETKGAILKLRSDEITTEEAIMEACDPYWYEKEHGKKIAEYFVAVDKPSNWLTIKVWDERNIPQEEKLLAEALDLYHPSHRNPNRFFMSSLGDPIIQSSKNPLVEEQQNLDSKPKQ
ncbi:hypothetical protein BN59_00895 [Legionella massiliensis]|uniref:Uncharacterized protein n=1 Tax=Legionella massiliensis TaxID=1034943 RepID=A0A078KUA7_9GAMM|nr:hypothetical protein [Legionella massiliensis]CDZ76621.1 hypothetical protein BN59_00895 [Legionella massiliensis]CEE12359.1 hypothetical protein BN1094_00895 [Legionella massiliensis]